MKEFYIPTEDGYLFCQVSGKGKPLILLHGNEEDHTIFINQIPYFNQFYQVIALDSRGHGRSGHGDGHLTFKKMARDILTTLTYFELDKVNIIGFSDGGNLGLYMAAHYPEKVNKLVIVGANYQADGLKKMAFFEVKALYFYLTFLGFISKAKRQRKEIIDLMWHQIKFKDADLKKITAKTLIVVGENDVIKTDHTSMIHELIVKSELITIPETTHFLMLEKPDQFNLMVKQFLEK